MFFSTNAIPTWLKMPNIGQPIVPEPQVDFSVKNFGKESVDEVIAGNGDLIFNGTSVKIANTGGKISAENCENFGCLNAGGKVKLKKCSKGSVNAGGPVEAKKCKDLGKISAGGQVSLSDTTVNNVSSGYRVHVRDSTVKELLEFSADSTIANSFVKSIIVHPNSFVNGKIITSMSLQDTTNVYLENTIVENIRFEVKGKIFLSGNSEVRGEVINGEIITQR